VNFQYFSYWTFSWSQAQKAIWQAGSPCTQWGAYNTASDFLAGFHAKGIGWKEGKGGWNKRANVKCPPKLSCLG